MIVANRLHHEIHKNHNFGFCGLFFVYKLRIREDPEHIESITFK